MRSVCILTQFKSPFLVSDSWCYWQGGFLFLETTALATFLRCFSSYLDCFKNILSGLQSSDKHIEEDKHSEEADISVDMTRPNSHSVKDYMPETHCTSPQAKGGQLEAFILNICCFSCALVIEDENGICKFFHWMLQMHNYYIHM